MHPERGHGQVGLLGMFGFGPNARVVLPISDFGDDRNFGRSVLQSPVELKTQGATTLPFPAVVSQSRETATGKFASEPSPPSAGNTQGFESG